MKREFTCPVCEWPHLADDPAFQNYNICEQCGTEFGNDGVPGNYAVLREEWIAGGRKFWYSPRPLLVPEEQP